jgi:LPS O-antigen subunit length determinant protein (WzzB/FepE family)
MLTMNSYKIATVSIIAAACLIAAAIAVPIVTNSAYAVQRIVGAPQTAGQATTANGNGLAGIAAGVQVQAQVGQVCVNALNSGPSC